jgi:hypothetical protein
MSQILEMCHVTDSGRRGGAKPRKTGKSGDRAQALTLNALRGGKVGGETRRKKRVMGAVFNEGLGNLGGSC